MVNDPQGLDPDLRWWNSRRGYAKDLCMSDNGPAIDVLGVYRGCIGGLIGINDWDLSRAREATEIVIWIFESRAKAHLGCRELKRTREMTLLDVDRHYGTTLAVELGAGKPPSLLATYPIKVVVKAEHGFTLDPIRTFERAVELIENGDWDQHPGRRDEPRPRADRVASVEQAGLGHAAPKARRLGASPRMDADGGRSYTAPMFKQQVKGYERTIKPTSWGTDEHGMPVLGMTYVRKAIRGKDKPGMPGAVYVEEPDAKTRRKAAQAALAATHGSNLPAPQGCP